MSKNSIRNQSGSALTMVLIAAAGIGLASFIFLNQNKMMSKINVATEADKQIENIAAEIAALFVDPNSCSVNFPNGTAKTGSIGWTGTISTTGFLKKCVAPPCSTAASGINWMNIGNTADWDLYAPTAVAAPYSKTQPGKVRIKKISWSTTEQKAHQDFYGNVGNGKFAPGILNITIMFEKNMGLQTNAGSVNVRTAQVTRDFNFRATVVTGNWTLAGGYAPTATLRGCSRNFSSTTPN